MNIKVYLDADDDVRLSRRVMKEYKAMGESLDLEEILEAYEKFVKPAHERFVEPSKKYADMIIPNYGFQYDENNDI